MRDTDNGSLTTSGPANTTRSNSDVASARRLDPAEKVARAAARIHELEAALNRAAFVAEHLHAMIDRDIWRASGGDDGQGHYEGDYRAEVLQAEIEGWKVIACGD